MCFFNGEHHLFYQWMPLVLSMA
ncbi:hypothetical protein OH492_14865 [Vibrio chagasii]|nr:hypothetical protein [Vibrio chagasii]